MIEKKKKRFVGPQAKNATEKETGRTINIGMKKKAKEPRQNATWGKKAGRKKKKCQTDGEISQ